jgi:hypothetical protein
MSRRINSRTCLWDRTAMESDLAQTRVKLEEALEQVKFV